MDLENLGIGLLGFRLTCIPLYGYLRLLAGPCICILSLSHRSVFSITSLSVVLFAALGIQSFYFSLEVVRWREIPVQPR